METVDGQIDRLIPVAGEEQKKAFRFLLQTNANSRLSDEHLWFSVFLRPKRSRFTRCQRVACCFSVLFLKMLVEAMWYEREPGKPSGGGLNIGPFSMTPEEVCIGLMCNLIVFPPTFLMVLLFRKARPRRLRKSRINVALERTRLSKGVSSDSGTQSLARAPQPPHSPRKLPHSPSQTPDSPQDTPDSHEESADSKEEKTHVENKEKSCTLPWWFALIAWFLAAACIVLGCFFLLMYGITFGNTKTTKWISALIISFFTEILLQEPIKIILVSVLMSAIFKTSHLDDDDSEEDEEEPELETDEAWLHEGVDTNWTHKVYKLDEETLARLREIRKREIEMWQIIREVLVYSIFLWVFLTITYGTRDPNAFLLHNNLKQVFLNLGKKNTDFTKATSSDLVWNYMYKGLLPNLRAGKLYNGKQPYGLRGFLNDQVNRIMGYATVRQIRTEGTNCSVPKQMRWLIQHCDGSGSMIEEDTRHYCGGWLPLNNQTSNFSVCSIPEFRYTSAAELNSLPVWGKVNWYGGGGYVIHLRASTDAIMAKLEQLQSNQWIDHKTRAVLIEFTVYNSQVNLFGMIVMMAEFIPGGGVVPSGRFDAISLIEPGNTFGSFIIACQVVFVMFILYFTGRECYLMCKTKSRYFSNYWSYAEVSIILASYVTIVIYVLRYITTNAVLNEFNRTFGNGYVRMQYAAAINEAYGYLVAFIVFAGTIKFIKLLRFNQTIGILSATVRQCWDDLSGFLVAFLLCYFIFVSMFFMLFNQHLRDFSSFVISLETCFSMLMGVFDYHKMARVSPMVGPVIFFIFVTLNVFVLFNLLIAIVVIAFAKIKEDALNRPSDNQVMDFMWMRFKTFFGGGEMSSEPPRTTAAPVNTGQDAQDNLTVQEFPDKVNKFLDYVNTVYFDGSLDTNSKDVFKSSLYKSSAPRQGSGIRGARE